MRENLHVGEVVVVAARFPSIIKINPIQTSMANDGNLFTRCTQSHSHGSQLLHVPSAKPLWHVSS